MCWKIFPCFWSSWFNWLQTIGSKHFSFKCSGIWSKIFAAKSMILNLYKMRTASIFFRLGNILYSASISPFSVIFLADKYSIKWVILGENFSTVVRSKIKKEILSIRQVSRLDTTKKLRLFLSFIDKQWIYWSRITLKANNYFYRSKLRKIILFIIGF